MNIIEYFKEWEDFDYFTFMSDSYDVYLLGRREKSRLTKLAGIDPILLGICEKFINHDDSLGRRAKPKLEDYIDV